MKTSTLRRVFVFTVVLGLMSSVPLANANDGPATTANGQSIFPNQHSPILDVFEENASEASPRAGCRIVTWEVGQTNQTLGVRGGRADCANYATYVVSLRKHRTMLPDLGLANASGGGNTTAVAYAGCRGKGTYFGEVTSSTGNKVQGARATRC